MFGSHNMHATDNDKDNKQKFIIEASRFLSTLFPQTRSRFFNAVRTISSKTLYSVVINWLETSSILKVCTYQSHRNIIYADWVSDIYSHADKKDILCRRHSAIPCIWIHVNVIWIIFTLPIVYENWDTSSGWNIFNAIFSVSFHKLF